MDPYKSLTPLICPILTRQPQSLTLCFTAECAWWNGQYHQCALWLLAATTADIALEKPGDAGTHRGGPS